MITGTNIYNYFKCKRQLHLDLIHININDSDNINIGKVIEEQTYNRRSKKYKQFNIGIGIVDYIDFDKKIIYETKKSSRLIELSIWQLKYYLSIFNSDWSGILEIPLERKKYNVKLNNSDISTINNAINYIQNINQNKIIPNVINKNYCKKCKYYQYCYV